jgi:hypothetical protein
MAMSFMDKTSAFQAEVAGLSPATASILWNVANNGVQHFAKV